MFIRLGNTKINYRDAKPEKYMLFAEVVNSPLSYETPVVINSISELNALFSKDFDDYIYLKRLLETYGNIGFYLFKPFSSRKSQGILESDEFLDYSGFTKIEPYDVFVPDKSYISYLEEWKSNPDLVIGVFNDDSNLAKGISYKRLTGDSWNTVNNPSSSLIFKGEPIKNSKLGEFKTLRDSDEVCIVLGDDVWVYCEGFGFILESELPQNLAGIKDSESLDNRSTIFIPSNSEIDYIHPEYRTGKELGIFSPSSDLLPNIPISSIKTDRIREGYETLALRLHVSEEVSDTGVFSFLRLGDDGSRVTYSFSTSSVAPRISEHENFITLGSTENIIDEVESSLSGTSITTFRDGSDLILCGRLGDLGYNTFTGLSLEPDYKITQSIIYKSCGDVSGIKAWSKTIGGTSELDDDGVIKIQIEHIENYEYLIIISRYDYTETFQGSIQNIAGLDRLDHIVSKNSKLLYLKFTGNLKEIKTGEFFLSRGTYTKDYKKEDWMNSLKIMFSENSSKNVRADFLLIPNIQDYVVGIVDKNYGYYREYETILKYCRANCFQALIQNSPSEQSFKEITDDFDSEFEQGTVYYIPGENVDEYLSEYNELNVDSGIHLRYNIESQECSYNGEIVRSVVFSDKCSNASESYVEPISLDTSNESWCTVNQRTGAVTFRENPGDIRAAIITAKYVKGGETWKYDHFAIQKGKTGGENIDLSQLFVYTKKPSEGGTSRLKSFTIPGIGVANSNSLVYCNIEGEKPEWCEIDSAGNVTFAENSGEYPRSVLVKARWRINDKLYDGITLVTQFGTKSDLNEYPSFSGNTDCYTPVSSNGGSTSPKNGWTFQQNPYTFTSVTKSVTFELTSNTENPGWEKFFKDGYIVQFRNSSKYQQVVRVPKRDTTTIGSNCLIQEYIVGPGKSIVLKVRHPERNIFEWEKIQVNSGYWMLGSNGELEKVHESNIIEEAVGGGNFIYNYLKDNSSWLLYFYDSIYTRTYGIKYPGYCIFIDGLMTGNYSGSVDNILYNTPVNDPYSSEPIEKQLEKYRSNYLVFNGQRYYYKKYLESPNKNSSLFLRFIIGKITREIFKKKGELIGEKVVGKIKQTITDILGKIESSFSIVESIELTNFNIDLENNTLNIEVLTAVKTLVDKDIVLNITLNLNK